MKHPRLLAFCTMLALLLIVTSSGAQDADHDNSHPAFGTQNERSPTGPGIASQPGDDKSLEIAPQDGAARAPMINERTQEGSLRPNPDRADDKAARQFRPSEDIAALNRNFHPHREFDGRLPYLGVTVQYATHCYLGGDERGLEVLRIEPGSPAAQAGLSAREAPSALGAVGAVGAALTGPGTFLITPLLEKSGALGHRGDLIVAIDDHRVRNEYELDYALRGLKPGDTMYVTVIHPLPGGSHQTMKIAIKVGDLTYNDSQPIGSRPNTGPSTTWAGESYAY